jgi:hypothetical protein
MHRCAIGEPAFFRRFVAGAGSPVPIDYLEPRIALQLEKKALVFLLHEHVCLETKGQNIMGPRSFTYGSQIDVEQLNVVRRRRSRSWDARERRIGGVAASKESVELVALVRTRPHCTEPSIEPVKETPRVHEG